MRNRRIKNCLSVIVRQGSVFSTRQLLDNSLDRASTVIILGEDDGIAADGGNALTIKTLMQVSDITSKYTSRHNQRVIVEVSDDWTQAIVNEILACKNGNCTEIVAVPVNELFGNIFTQFAVMPKLNSAYNELFSNDGVELYSGKTGYSSESDFVLSYIENHSRAIPLTIREENGGSFAFYLGEEEKDISAVCSLPPVLREIHLFASYMHSKEKIVILGHNKNLINILTGIRQYNNEWEADGNGVRVFLLDDGASLEKHEYYKDFPFIEKCISVDIHQRDLISEQLCEQLDGSDITVLILSSDNSGEVGKDFCALANLIYLQSALNKKAASNFNPSSVDVVVEIIEPKHHDIVQNYSQSNVVISNRYVSRMIMQLSEKSGLYGFFKDILTFDSAKQAGKEIYLKQTANYFAKIPETMPIRDFVYSLYKTTLEKKGRGEVAIGWMDAENRIFFFHGDMASQTLTLSKGSQLIILSDH